MTKREGGSNTDSPARRVAQQQSMAGAASGQQERGEEPRTERAVPQTSNRRNAKREHEQKVRRGYEAAEHPEKQGDGDPGPDQIRESPAMQDS